MKQYDSYKASGVEWIGIIPSHWVCTRLKFVCGPLKSGGTPKSDEPRFYSQGGTPWVAISDMSSNSYIYDTEKHLTHEGIEDKKLTIYPIGTILYSIYATLGKVSELRIPACINQAILAIYPKSALEHVFFKYCLQAQEQFIYSLSNGNTQNNLNANIVSNFMLVIPPRKEQYFIASYLDKKCAEIDKAIETQTKRIELLKELRQNIITHAVTRGLNPDAPLKDSGVEWIGQVPEHWEIRKIKYICQSKKYPIKTGPFGSQLKGQELQPDGDVRVYNQRNVIDNNFSETQFYVSNKKAQELDSFYTLPSDLLITSRGTIGKCAVLPCEAPMGILHPCLIALRIDQSICNIKWAQLFIGESSCFATNVKLNSNATTIEVIYTDTLKNVSITIPPLQEQEQIVSHIEMKMAQVNMSITKAERQISLLLELKQSIITEVVTGKRKVC